MLHSAWNNRGAIMSIASRVAPLMLAENNVAKDPEQPYAIKANYLYELEMTLKTLQAL